MRSQYSHDAVGRFEQSSTPAKHAAGKNRQKSFSCERSNNYTLNAFSEVVSSIQSLKI